MNKDQIEQLISIQEKANESYYNWIRHMMALATGELTALIALQDQFVPAAPRHLWTLSATWISLASALLSAGVVLYGEHDVHGRMCTALLRQFREQDVNGIPLRPTAILPTKIHKTAAIAFPTMLVSSLVFLCWFALANLGNR